MQTRILPVVFRMGLIFVLGFWCMPKTETLAQNLCDPLSNPNYVSNGFEIDGPSSGCGPFNVKLNDLTGYSNIKYDFYYQGDGRPSGSSSITNTYFDEPEITPYTILQYGTKADGSPFYSCKNVSVLPDAEPVFSVNACDNHLMIINIPNATENSFDYYQISFLDDGSSVTVQASELPYSENFSSVNATTRDILIEGMSNTGSTGCSSPTPVTVDMKTGNDYVSIDSLVVKDENTVSLSFSGGLNQEYSIYQRTINGSYPAYDSPTKKETPGTYDFNINTSQQYCYGIFGATCHQSSAEICTIPIDPIKVVDQKKIVEWISHPTDNFTLLASGVGFGSSGTNKNIIPTLEKNGSVMAGVSDSPYEEQLLDCSESVCFQMIAQIDGVTKGNDRIPYESFSKSRKVCLDLSTFMPAPINDLYVTVNDNEQPEITAIDDADWPLSRQKYYLLTEQEGAGFMATDSSNTAVAPIQFVDPVSAANGPYCYKITYQDSCGRISEPSPEVCTIQITYNDQSNLIWSNSAPFNPDIVNNYILYYEDPTGGVFQIDNGAQLGNFSFRPDLTGLSNSARYFIEVESSNGRISKSNYIDLPISTKIYIADAFTPNGANPQFELKGNLLSLNNFNFKIFNRWGELIFETNDKNNFWDGRLKSNRIAPVGLYHYVLKATDIHNELIQRTGSFLLLK
ncbi:gliding motility-associated C-terminal domain-containing protein [Marinilongibacter aquaticus]|uniref:gliding motility-associated C-terminal domain-containing protein n=1 Tax=Marinilongibacter aquaticus TaxID=2975157 RepID=UPI0021BDAE47|nr:gliding motility-associated C-terminal domain-containing protein [Marinilongibacter aquaticus]UBM57654.1 gliding motility-associated C-terminal domain-containing protein [Marinilongibacter aquaticus]